MEIIKKDIRELNSFKKFDSTFTKIWSDEDRHLYVFKRVKIMDDGKERIDYEVIKGVKTKNPDGSIVYAYPSSDNFGTYGYYIMGIPVRYSRQRIVSRLKKFDEEVDLSGLSI